MSEEAKLIREKLAKLSLEVKPLVEEGEFETINEAIINTFYKDDKHKNFKLFNQWRKENCKVIKGEKGFPVWTRKQLNQKFNEVGECTDEYKFFKVCFLFSNAQVTSANI